MEDTDLTSGRSTQEVAVRWPGRPRKSPLLQIPSSVNDSTTDGEITLRELPDPLSIAELTNSE